MGTIDKNQAATLLRLMKKYVPETREQKKARLMEMAQQKKDGQEVKTKKPQVIKYGLNHVTTLIENKEAKLVVIAHDFGQQLQGSVQRQQRAPQEMGWRHYGHQVPARYQASREDLAARAGKEVGPPDLLSPRACARKLVLFEVANPESTSAG